MKVASSCVQLFGSSTVLIGDCGPFGTTNMVFNEVLWCYVADFCSVYVLTLATRERGVLWQNLWDSSGEKKKSHI
jgi:hypothetical protein